MQDRLNQILATRRSLLQLLYRRSSIAMALALHLGAVLFLFLGPVLFAEKKQNWEYVDVQVVPASALPQPAPRTGQQNPTPRESRPEPVEPEPTPIEPPPQPEPDRPRLPTEVPEKQPEPEPPRPEPTPPPQPEPERTPEAEISNEPTSDPVDTEDSPPGEPGPPSQDPISGTGPGGAPGPIAKVGPAGVLGFDDASFTYSYYVDRMLAAIAAQWSRPPVGRDIELIVHFVIASDGTVQELEIVTPSGIRAFDRAGERAVLSASPLPPLPRSYRKESLGVTLIIQ